MNTQQILIHFFFGNQLKKLHFNISNKQKQKKKFTLKNKTKN